MNRVLATATGLLCCVLISACATPSQPAQHGTMSTLSESKNPTELCQHKVPRDVCALCHPELVAKFKATGDWCGEHSVPESQCLTCHPDLTFTPVSVPAGADYKRLSNGGEDVASLEPHAVRGKVTIFDFYADWCAPCRQLDEHILGLMKQRDDIAYRRLNLGGWETPLAKRYMANVRSLPYVVVYGKSGTRLRDVSGLDLAKVDQAIADANVR
jgi:thiol-disulfide isomerase/thioredoxin